MSSHSDTNSADRTCIKKLAEHEQQLKQFICKVESRERNFTETLKNINDTLEALVAANDTESSKFLSKDSSKLISWEKKKKKKHLTSKKQRSPHSQPESEPLDEVTRTQTSASMNLKDLAKNFERMLRKAKDLGLPRLIEPIKKSAMMLRELSQVGYECGKNNLEADKKTVEVDSSGKSAIYRSKPKKEFAIKDAEENPCHCGYEKSTDRSSEDHICDESGAHDEHLSDEQRVSNLRREGKRHKSKDKKKKRSREKKEKEKRTRNNIAINDREPCGCPINGTTDTSGFARSDSIILGPCPYRKNNEESFERDDITDRSTADEETLRNDLKVLRSLIQSVAKMDRSPIRGRKMDDDTDKKDKRRNRSEEGDKRSDKMISEMFLPADVIHESSIDKNLDGWKDHEYRPPDDYLNAKDEACGCAGEAKESGRTNGSKGNPKDHGVKDVEDVDRVVNVEISQTTKRAPCSAIEKIEKSPSGTNIFRLDARSGDEQPELIEEYLEACPCGCEAEEIEEEYSCSCSKEAPINISDTSDTPYNVNLFFVPMKNRISGKEKSLEVQSASNFFEDVKTTTKKCLCGCGELTQIVHPEDNVPWPRSEETSNFRQFNDHVEDLAKQLEEEIKSVQAKNEDLVKLIESFYRDENVAEILELQSSQPPAIRATHSGLISAIEILRSKSRTKDRIIGVLAGELRGSKSIDQITRNLTAPCLQFTFWDFDQCSVYSYIKRKKKFIGESSDTRDETNNDLPIEKPSGVGSQRKFAQPAEPKNFRVVRETCNCLLVCWDAPDDVRGVKGYEIVVNNKIIAARMTDPMKTEAVLGPFDPDTSTRLTLYAIDAHGRYSKPCNIVL